MTWVKVCGFTEITDVAAAVAAGVDAVGFVNIGSSPRFVTKQQAFDLADGVPALTILLTLDVDPDEGLSILRHSSIDGLQPYGRNAGATARAVMEAGGVVLFPQRAGAAIASTPGIPLLDTPADGALGGTGKTFDWALAAGLPERFVLAGGLGPDNIAAAISTVQPWGVDASSRLELSPGRKDRSMVASFIERAKEK